MTKSEQKEFSKLRSDNEVLRERHLNCFDQLTNAWAALESARAELKRVNEELDQAPDAEELRTVRALAMEEAARLLDEEFLGSKRVDAERAMGIRVGAAIRALAPLPASLVAVPRETVTKVRELLKLKWCPKVDTEWCIERAAALALLDEVSK